HQFVPADGQVDRSPNADAVQGVDLRAEQVERETRVHGADRGGAIAIAVVAARKHGHRVHARGLHRGREFGRVEVDADIGDGSGSVKVEVDLAQPKVRGP